MSTNATYKLGILCTHPIQYYSPLFRYLAKSETVDLTVYYCHKPSPDEQGVGFGVPFNWDIDLLSGHNYVWLNNLSKLPLQGFNGCDTPEISHIIQREKFDAFLVLGWHTRSMWQAMSACWKNNTPLFVRGDSHLHIQMPLLKRIVKEATHRYFIPRFTACLAVGKWSREYFEHYGARKILSSPHFVDNDWFVTNAERYKLGLNQIRREWKIPEDVTVFLFAGKFESKKRPLDLLLALKKMIEKGVEKRSIFVLMAGDGKLKAKCEEFVNRYQLPVLFTGFLNQTEMPKVYSVVNVLVLLSDGRETWGLVVNEAMACGVPAIVSDKTGCHPDLIKEGETGFTFPCGHVDFLANRMHKIAEKSIAARMGKAAQKHVAAYSVDVAARGILEAIDLVSDRHAKT